MAERNLEPAALERRTRDWDKSKCVHAIKVAGLKVTMEPGVSWRYPEGGEVYVEARRCVYCNHLDDLGETCSGPGVGIELRAAELAVTLDFDDSFSFEEALGFLENTEGFGGSKASPEEALRIELYALPRYTAHTWAGWLAAEIVQHEQKEP